MTIACCLRSLEDLVSPNSNVHVLVSVGKNQRSVLNGVVDLKLESFAERFVRSEAFGNCGHLSETIL